MTNRDSGLNMSGAREVEAGQMSPAPQVVFPFLTLFPVVSHVFHQVFAKCLTLEMERGLDSPTEKQLIFLVK